MQLTIIHKDKKKSRKKRVPPPLYKTRPAGPPSQSCPSFKRESCSARPSFPCLKFLLTRATHPLYWASVHHGRPSLCSGTGPRPSEKLARSPAPPPMDGPCKAGAKLQGSPTPCAHERPEQDNKAPLPHVSFPRRITHHGAVCREMEQIDTLKDPESQLPDSG